MKSHPLFEKLRIFAPGPTPVPDLVLAEMARSPLHHRTKEFVEIFQAESGKIKNAKWLAQGTIYPDVIESAGKGKKGATTVTSAAMKAVGRNLARAKNQG